MNDIVIAIIEIDIKRYILIYVYNYNLRLPSSDHTDPNLMVRSSTKIMYSLSRCKQFYWLGPVPVLLSQSHKTFL